MRDRETIDSELRRVASELRSIRERGGLPSSQQVDALLDERLGHPIEVLCDTAVLDEILAPFEESLERPRRRRRRRAGLLRLALRAAVPLSAIAIAAVLVMMFVMRQHHRPSEPAATSSEEQSAPISSPPLVSTTAHPSHTDIAEKAMVDALQHEGVPMPNGDYASTQGHAVCDFLGKNSNFNDATQFVQRTTIWDAQQSADFAAAAVVTYCPQFESKTNDQIQQAFQKSVSNLQTIEGNLRGINHDLQGISDGLHPDS